MDEIIETGKSVTLSHRNYSGGVQIVTVTEENQPVEMVEVDGNKWRPPPPGGDPGSCSYHLKNGSFIHVRMNARHSAGRVRIHVETLPYTIAFTEPDDPGLNYSGKKIEESEEGAP